MQLTNWKDIAGYLEARGVRKTTRTLLRWTKQPTNPLPSPPTTAEALDGWIRRYCGAEG